MQHCAGTSALRLEDCQSQTVLVIRTITIHQIVALLGLALAISVYALLNRFGVPGKICLGAAILSILVVGIFWSAVQLGAEDEDEE